MKTKAQMMIIAVLSATLATAGFSNPADSRPELVVNAQQADSTTFAVYGKCGMCKKRIEKAANELEGVKEAKWDVSTRTFAAQYDASKVSEKEIHEKIASVGHDTETVRATDEAYSSLPGCCKYDRPVNE